MFFSTPTLNDIKYRLDDLVDDFDHSDLRYVIKDIENIAKSSGSAKAGYLNALARELSRCETGSELSGVRYDRYLDKANRS